MTRLRCSGQMLALRLSALLSVRDKGDEALTHASSQSKLLAWRIHFQHDIDKPRTLQSTDRGVPPLEATGSGRTAISTGSRQDRVLAREMALSPGVRVKLAVIAEPSSQE